VSLASNRLVDVLANLSATRAGGVAPYVTAGDGGLDRTLEVLFGLQDGGAVCVELGVPFSDPVADGPALAAAAERALRAGTTLDGVVELVRRYRAGGGTLPIVAFSYLNPLLGGSFERGLVRRLGALAAAGVDGLLVPDLPVHEAGPVLDVARRFDLATCLFVAPTTNDARARQVIAATDGFVYAVGRVGVTGAGTHFDDPTHAYLARVRELAGRIPVGVGFGLRDADQVAAALRYAELAIVGTALVERLHAAATTAETQGADGIAAARAAATEFVAALASPRLSSPRENSI